MDTVIIGISTDPVTQQQKFTAKESLTFPLLADNQQKVAKEFGVLPAGKTTAQRSTFIIDKQGTIVKIFPTVAKAGAHPQEVLDYAQKSLKK